MTERVSILLLALLLALLLLVTAPAALALPVEVSLSGVVSNVEGVAPGGIAASTPFSASIGYDPSADQNPSYQGIEIPGPEFSLQLEIGGESFAFDSASGPARFTWSAFWVDEEIEPAEPGDPGAVPLWWLDGYGAVQHVGTNSTYIFAVRFGILPSRPYPDYLNDFALPLTAAEAVQLMADGPDPFADYLYLSNTDEICWSWGGPSSCDPASSDFWVESTITSAAAIPEPGTAIMLLLGLVAIGTAERARRFTAVLRGDLRSLKSRFGWIFNTPSHHRVHHGRNIRYLDRNHAGILIVWDRLFGTFEPECEPVDYGLTRNIETFNPFRIAFHAWADLFRDMRNARDWREAAAYFLRPPGWSPDGSSSTSAELRRGLALPGGADGA